MKAISGTLLFGFNIPCLIEAREKIINMPSINRKHSYTEASVSQQNKRLHSLAKDFEMQSTTLLKSNNINQNRLCSFRSIKSLLNILIPIWKKTSLPILNLGDTIKLKFGGDGHIVTNQYSHVMFTMCLLNEKNEVLKPNKQYW